LRKINTFKIVKKLVFFVCKKSRYRLIIERQAHIWRLWLISRFFYSARWTKINIFLKKKTCLIKLKPSERRDEENYDSRENIKFSSSLYNFSIKEFFAQFIKNFLTRLVKNYHPQLICDFSLPPIISSSFSHPKSKKNQLARDNRVLSFFFLSELLIRSEFQIN
jgi:hypothetical protein